MTSYRIPQGLSADKAPKSMGLSAGGLMRGSAYLRLRKGKKKKREKAI